MFSHFSEARNRAVLNGRELGPHTESLMAVGGIGRGYRAPLLQLKFPGQLPAASSTHTGAGAVSFEWNVSRCPRAWGSVSPSNTTEGSNRVGGGRWSRAACPHPLVPAKPLCFYLSDVWESLTTFFEEGATHWEVESPWPTGFIHLLSTYYVPDIVLGTGDTAAKQIDKKPCPPERVC